MSKRISIDPITRIEGHPRIDCEVDGGKVTQAWPSGRMWRGVEQILLGRDPRDAWAITQRICGVCTTVHAIASVRAVENVLQLEVPLTFNPSTFPKGEQMGVGFHEAPRRAMRRTNAVRTRRHSSVRRWPIPNCRWKSSARCIPSIPAWLARCI